MFGLVRTTASGYSERICRGGSGSNPGGWARTAPVKAVKGVTVAVVSVPVTTAGGVEDAGLDTALKSQTHASCRA